MALSLAVDDSAQPPSKKLPQYLVAALVTTGAFSIGNWLAWTAPAIPHCTSNGSLAMTAREVSGMCVLLPLGALLGTLPAGIIADTIGRKKAILITALPLGLCSLLIAHAARKIWIFLARFCAGLACGVASIVIPTYLSEIAEEPIRGFLGTMFQLQLALGILFTYATGFAKDLFTISALCAVAPGLLAIAAPLVPESPAWLIMRERRREADYAIKRLRGRDYRSDEEIARLERGRELAGQRAGVFELRHCGKATVVTLGLTVFQQLSGATALICYAVSIFRRASSAPDATVCSVIMGIALVAATCFSAVLIDRVGRKLLLFLSASIMAGCMFILSGYFHFQNTHDVATVNWLPLLAVAVFTFVFGVGLGPIPWLMIDELFAPNVKNAANFAMVICNWVLGFFAINCFQDLADAMGVSFAFATFGMIGLMGTLFIAKMVPETQGKIVEQVQMELRRITTPRANVEPSTPVS